MLRMLASLLTWLGFGDLDVASANSCPRDITPEEQEAFTGMINIFGLRGLLGTCHLNLPHLRCAFRKAHRLIGDITQLDSPFILQFISTPASEVSGQTCFLAAAVSCPLIATSSSRKIAALFKIPDICIEIRLLGEKNKGDKQ